MSDENISAKGLKEPVYSHKTHGLTRAEMFDRFAKQFETYMGSQVGTIGATLISQKPKYDKKYYGYKQLISASGYDIATVSDQAKFQKIQWTIMNVLQKNFYDSDSTLFDECSRDKIAATHAANFPNHVSAHWIPFGTILHDRLRIGYTDEAGTDAVVKILNHEQQKLRFLKINQLQAFLTWRNKILESWNQLNLVVAKHEPSYLAALQLLEVVRRHPDARLKQFALTFNDKHKDQSFTMVQLLEHLTSNFKARDLASKSDKLMGPAPIAQVNAAHGAPTGGGGKRTCKNHGTCKGFTKHASHAHCDSCFIAYKAGIGFRKFSEHH